MKIESVEAVPVDRYLFVKVITDSGLVGYGESGAWGFLEASSAAINKFARYLVGKDPLLIEHHWLNTPSFLQSIYRTCRSLFSETQACSPTPPGYAMLVLD